MLHDQPMGLLAAVQNQDLHNAHQKRTTTFRMANGSSKTVPLIFRDVYKDEYTSEPLPSAWVESAIQDEIEYFNAKVWVGVPIQEALSDPAAKIIGTRWVVCNKNDTDDPDIRARLVAQEVNVHGDPSLFAATPPLDSKRMLFSQWSTERSRQGVPLKLSFVDIRKA